MISGLWVAGPCLLVGSGVTESVEVVFFESVVVSDLVEEGDADLFVESVALLAGVSDDGSAEDVDLIGEDHVVLDGTFGEADAGVESEEVVVGFHVEFCEEVGVGFVVDDEGHFLESVEDGLWEVVEDMIEDPVESLAHWPGDFVHGVRLGGYRDDDKR